VPDKLIHFLIYLLLAFILVNTLIIEEKHHPYLGGVLYAFTLGLVIESLQFFIPYRSFEIKDIFFNLLGSITGISLRIIKEG
jgi:VanZ family protein